MRRLFLVCSLMFVCLICCAQSEFQLRADAGWSTLLRPESEGKRLNSVGYGASLSYAYFFSTHVGLGLGVDAHQMGGGTVHSFTTTQTDARDSEGEPYHRITDYTNYTHRYQLWYIAPNLSLQVRVPLNKVELRLAFGAQYMLPLSGSMKETYTARYTGLYPKWGNMLVEDIPQYGFLTEDIELPKAQYKPQNSIAAFCRLGIGVPINRHWIFLAGANILYGFAAPQPLTINAEVGIACRLNKVRKREICRCVND